MSAASFHFEAGSTFIVLSNSNFGARAVYAALAKTGSTAVSECACEAQTEGNHGGGRRQRGGLCQEAAEGPQ